MKYAKAPNLKTYEIWNEGYFVTGNFQPPYLMGTAKGTDFPDACRNLFKEKQLGAVFIKTDADGHTYYTDDYSCQLFEIHPNILKAAKKHRQLEALNTQLLDALQIALEYSGQHGSVQEYEKLVKLKKELNNGQN